MVVYWQVPEAKKRVKGRFHLINQPPALPFCALR
jgi:hypothetical protein